MQWRDLVKFMGPSWLTKDVVQINGQSYESDSRTLRAMMSLFDVQRQRLKYGVLARFTQSCPVDALPFVGRGLDTIQGPSEPVAAYRARLQTAIDDKRLTGIAWPLLRQIRGYCSPYAVRVRIVNERGHWYTIDRDGSQSTYRYSAWNWDNARAQALQLGTVRTKPNGQTGPAIPWSRFWVIIYPTLASGNTPTQPWQRDGTWGDGQTWGDNGQTWGSTATPGDVQAIRRICQRWRPFGTRCVSIIVCFSDTDFSPASSSPPLPDGSWTWASKYSTATPGRRVPSRDSNALYWDGTKPGAAL